ncbi:MULTISPECIES: VOC family protein [Marichromatium]|uniref:Glyoxalase-like protein n=1 Tax=Marichromatium gracile TaxID=1048 RepID=A0A4R4A7S3_MARGR|nr:MULTISPECIES: VOC family protein [Marichromatium]MBO8085423.1 VOC family protein [Marichromatium sp.]MBK1708925.1 hypothetical protein [Marichromatium gracile]RNE89411.1 VOC family protein [Marichromatium sp. AB31]RNE93653.1 VOC family protein [Marichromatium sp. AB32]TCW34912.1 glyoxalase-like protein [Marichromatium gracile]
MKTRCSHVLVRVNDLHRAVDDYRRLGFQVDYATPRERAQHAHVWFSDGPVIELLTTPANARWFKWPIDLIAGRGAGRRMIGWSARGEGFCDLAVVTDSGLFDATRKTLCAAGIPIGRAVRWRRRRADGSETRFSFAYPRDPALPFMVSPYQPRQHPATIRHANGASRLSRVRLGAPVERHAEIRRIIGDDPTIVLEDAPSSGVRTIELTGLTETLDPALLHGATIRAASAEQDCK